jgi:glycosyltransferase involved in cell wall biosynthesis
MGSTPLVSVIVPTYNSEATLADCLQSIEQQTYKAIELIVVDNHSRDTTLTIARSFTSHVFTRGPERSAQRNYGVNKAQGSYVCIIDSDMQLSPDVISHCVLAMQRQPNTKGIIIPEESFGEGFWAQCKKLERSFYVGVDWMEAARFFDIKTYRELGGYDSSLVSGEDWDLSQRVAELAPLKRIRALIYHNEGRLRLSQTLSKKYYYAKLVAQYLAKQGHGESTAKQTDPFRRYGLYLSHPRRLLRQPHVAMGMLFMKTMEGFAGVFGLIAARKNKDSAVADE